MSMKKHIAQIVIFFFLFSLLLSACDGSTQVDLRGSWQIDWTSSSSSSLYGDLNFDDHKKLEFVGAYSFDSATLRYAVISPGKMKLTVNDNAQVVDFFLDGDLLQINFPDGTNYYQRVKQNQLGNDQGEASTPDPNQISFDIFPTQETVIQPTNTNRPIPTTAPTPVQARTPTNKPNQTPVPTKYYPLGDCAASQLSVGDSAFVNFATGSITIRNEPVARIGNSAIRKLSVGEVLHVIGGPVCDMGWVFWEVRTVNSEKGWLPEGDSSEFWILPIHTRDVCSGAKPTRLVIGGRAFVEPMPVDHNRIYPEPIIDASKLLYRMRPGSYMKVLDGPSCGNGQSGVWWYVESEDSGIRGWTRESDYVKDYYFIAPVITDTQ